MLYEHYTINIYIIHNTLIKYVCMYVCTYISFTVKVLKGFFSFNLTRHNFYTAKTARELFCAMRVVVKITKNSRNNQLVRNV